MKQLFVSLICICSLSLLFGEGEFIIDTNYVSFPGVGNKFCPDPAFDGTNYMIVWTDYRNGFPAIYGTRVSESWVILDTFGIAIKTDRWAQDPAVAFDGTNYFVVWREYLPYCDYQEFVVNAVAGARVSTGGTLLDTTSITIDSGSIGCPACPEIAFDGTNYLVVWNNTYGQYSGGIRGARVSPSGMVLDVPSIRISPIWLGGDLPRLAYGDSAYLVVWHYMGFGSGQTGDIFAARVSPSGAVIDTAGIPVAVGSDVRERNAAVAFDGTNFFVVYQCKPQNWIQYIAGKRITQSGIVIDTTEICLSDTTVPMSVYSAFTPEVMYDETKYLVTWHSWTSNSVLFALAGSRVTLNGVDLDTNDIIVNASAVFSEYNSHFVKGNSKSLLVWQRRHGSDASGECKIESFSIGAAIIDSTLHIIGLPFNAGRVKIPGRQTMSASGFDGTNYFVCWQDKHYDTLSASYSSLYGLRVNSAGTIIDTNAIPICNFRPAGLTDYRGGAISPCIAFGDSIYLVVWLEEIRLLSGWITNADVYGARVRTTGEVLDSLGFQISLGGIPVTCSDPAVTFDGRNFMAVWQDFRQTAFGQIYGARIGLNGTVIDTLGFNIGYYSELHCPKLAFGGGLYMVVWEDWRYGYKDIYGARVDTAGNMLDSISVPISQAVRGQYAPVAAFDGANFLVVWQDERNDGGGWPLDSSVIYCSRVTQSGIVLDTQGIMISALDKVATSPQVCFDGTNYLVVWEQYTDDGTYDLYGAKVNSAGNVLNTYLVASHAYDQIEPSLCRGNGDQTLVTYTSKTTNLGNRGIRVERIWGKLYPFVGVEEDHRAAVAYDKCRLQVTSNPFSARKPVQFTIIMGTVQQKLKLKIYDVLGRLLKTYAVKFEPGNGEYSISWNGDDTFGRKASAGVYYCRLETDAGSRIATEKIVFIY
ncbi:MAG TPA: FlgD immunoglobulin-like domain containing protein [bacterium]